MKISIIVATFNGEETLKDSLGSLNTLDIPEDVELKIIYIDNNSTDSTPEILNSFDCRFNFTHLDQKKKGKNAALNTVFEHPELLGELLIFSDDDVIFPIDFIKRYQLLSSQWPGAGIFGGRIDARWPTEPEQALLDGVDKVVAFAITPTDWGYESGIIDPVKIHGPNMAVRAELLTDIRFNENIGPNGGNYMMGSETELLFRLKEAGVTAVFDFDNAVQHIIMPYQFDVEWLSSRAYKAGRSMVMHQIKNGEFSHVPEVLGYPRWALVQVVKLKIKKWFTSKSNSEYYRALWRSSHLTGYCSQYKQHCEGAK